MIEPHVDIATRDFELTADGDLKMNTDSNMFQDFWGDVVVELGNDIFDLTYGVPWSDISQFGRIEATDKLIESYLTEKAVLNGIQLSSFDIVSRTPFYSIIVGYIDENQNTQSQIINLSQ